MKVLVVDDSGTMRRIVSNGLAKIGIKDIVEADNGETALEAFKKGGIELIISDWNMPVMDGYDLILAIRELDKTVPILMVTTNAASQDVIKAIQAGATNYVVKPFTPDTLLEKVQAILG